MQLAHIDLGKLAVSPFNLRDGKRAPDISDIVPSIRRRGILQPLLVPENCSPDTFDIVAERRRYYAAKTIADEGEPVEPCAPSWNRRRCGRSRSLADREHHPARAG